MLHRKLLLLGGTGYVGRHLVPVLAVDNDVTLLTRHSSDISFLNKLEAPARKNIRTASLDDLCFGGFMLTNGSGGGYDWFINLSCSYMRAGNYRVWESNYEVPSGVLLKLGETGVFPDVLTIGTGLPDNFNLYGFSKKQFLDLCNFCNRKNQHKIVNVELENFYGEDEPRDRFLPGVIQKLLEEEPVELTEGYQHRDFIYIDDVVNGIRSILHHYSESHDNGLFEVPLGTGEAPTVREIITFCKEITHSSSELLFGAVPLRWNEPDSVADTAALSKIGFSPQYKWRDGMKHMIERFKL